MARQMISTYTPDEIHYEKRSVVTVGSFDGVHRAHQRIIATVVSKARTIGGRSVLVTFDPHPQNVLRPQDPLGILTSLDERRELCGALGVDILCIVPFTYEFSRTPWQSFLKDVIVRDIGVTEMVEGFNHHFGRDREGGIQSLRSMGEELGFTVTSIDPVVIDGIEVSSTKIRHRLLLGEVGIAGRLLGRPYWIRGTVVLGDKRGAGLGYPTANIELSDQTKLVPQNGIYIVTVEGDAVGRHHGLASIGVRPTFHDAGPRTIEVYILGYEGDLYGSELRIGFLSRLRGEEKFRSREDLISQMNKDKEDALSFLAAGTSKT